MGLTDKVFGTPGTTTVHQAGGTKDPGYDFAKQFFNFLGSIMGTQYPTFKGSIDPGLSPTMQDTLRRAQGYAASSPAEILQGVQGSIGRFMSPSFLNPANALFGNFGGAPNYFGVDPNQRIYGGGPASSMGWDPNMGGMGGGMGGGGGMPSVSPSPDQMSWENPNAVYSPDAWQEQPGAWGPGGFTPGGQQGPNQMTWAIGRQPQSMPMPQVSWR